MPPRYHGTSCRRLSHSLEVEIHPPPKAIRTKLLGGKERRAFLEVNKEQTDARSKLTDLGLPHGASCPLICHGRTHRQGPPSPLLQSVFLPFPFSLHHLSPRRLPSVAWLTQPMPTPTPDCSLHRCRWAQTTGPSGGHVTSTIPQLETLLWCPLALKMKSGTHGSSIFAPHSELQATLQPYWPFPVVGMCHDLTSPWGCALEVAPLWRTPVGGSSTTPAWPSPLLPLRVSAGMLHLRGSPPCLPTLG